MKKGWKVGVLVLGLVVLTLTTAFAAEDGTVFGRGFLRGLGGQRGFEILAEKAGLSEEEIQNLIIDGKTCYEIAEENDVAFEEIRDEMIKEKITLIDEKVKAGDLTEEQGELIKKRIEERSAWCNGLGLGRGAGQAGRGNGFGRGINQGCGFGRGFGFNRDN